MFLTLVLLLAFRVFVVIRKVQRCNSTAAAAVAATWPLRNVRLSIYMNYFRTPGPNMPPFFVATPPPPSPKSRQNGKRF